MVSSRRQYTDRKGAMRALPIVSLRNWLQMRLLSMANRRLVNEGNRRGTLVMAMVMITSRWFIGLLFLLSASAYRGYWSPLFQLLLLKLILLFGRVGMPVLPLTFNTHWFFLLSSFCATLPLLLLLFHVCHLPISFHSLISWWWLPYDL